MDAKNEDYELRRYSSLRRILTTINVLSGFRGGATIVQFNKALNEATGDTWCERTTSRDLKFLEQFGLVDSFLQGQPVRGKMPQHFKIRQVGFERLIRLVSLAGERE